MIQQSMFTRVSYWEVRRETVRHGITVTVTPANGCDRSGGRRVAHQDSSAESMIPTMTALQVAGKGPEEGHDRSLT